MRRWWVCFSILGAMIPWTADAEEPPGLNVQVDPLTYALGIAHVYLEARVHGHV